MAERIQLSIQLPLEELGRFSRLVEQLRQMMDAGEPAGGGRREDSPAFDPLRFQELMARESAAWEQAPARESVPQPTAYRPGDLPPAPGARQEPSYTAEIPSVRAETVPLPEAPAVRGEVSPLGDAPTAGGDLSPLADPVSAWAETSPLPEITAGQIEAALGETHIPTATPGESAALPEAPAPGREVPQREEALPSPARGPAQEQVFQELTAPVAGYYPAVQLPEAPGGSWQEVREELTYAGPAPLTAEAVSLAFQRDDRRYDNGFPLY